MSKPEVDIWADLNLVEGDASPTDGTEVDHDTVLTGVPVIDLDDQITPNPADHPSFFDKPLEPGLFPRGFQSGVFEKGKWRPGADLFRLTQLIDQNSPSDSAAMWRELDAAFAASRSSLEEFLRTWEQKDAVTPDVLYVMGPNNNVLPETFQCTVLTPTPSAIGKTPPLSLVAPKSFSAHWNTTPTSTRPFPLVQLRPEDRTPNFVYILDSQDELTGEVLRHDEPNTPSTLPPLVDMKYVAEDLFSATATPPVVDGLGAFTSLEETPPPRVLPPVAQNKTSTQSYDAFAAGMPSAMKPTTYMDRDSAPYKELFGIKNSASRDGKK